MSEGRGTLYVIGTPIGNLEDISARARRVLGGATVCYAEDTRRTGRLLASLEASTPLRSLHEHNERARVEEIVGRLERGETVALVSDAGTPVVSDPGARLVEAVLAVALPVSPVPGPSAVAAALSVSGLPADRYWFAGFPPRRGDERNAWLERAAATPDTVVVFEAPARLSDLLGDLAGAGLAERRAIVCRELTKLHETVRPGTIAELATVYATETVKGEVTVVMEGAPDGGEPPDEAIVLEAARDLAREGAGGREIADRLRERFGLSRNEAYRLSLKIERESDE